MTLGTILYILLFFVSVFISIMYLEFGAMALMGLMVTIPVHVSFSARSEKESQRVSRFKKSAGRKRCH